VYRLHSVGPGSFDRPLYQRRTGGFAGCARKSLDPNSITGENLARVRALNEIAKGRGQTLAQMALAWVLRNPPMTSTLVGASSVKQLEDNVAAVQRLEFSSDELAEIDRYAVESGVDLWAEARETPAAQTAF
jgi:L-glyceraldehyde 3-phosphate reductase